jgi:hypothetical protein
MYPFYASQEHPTEAISETFGARGVPIQEPLAQKPHGQKEKFHQQK